MADNGSIVRLVPKANPDEKSRQYVVDMLEEVLAKAKAGEFVAMGIAASCGESVTYTNYAGRDNPVLLGALQRLTYRIIENE